MIYILEIMFLIIGLAFVAVAVAKPENKNKNFGPLIKEDEFYEGGPPPDGIPSIDSPVFMEIEEACEWLAEREPVVVLNYQGEVRAYPLQVLIWHEIVNDQINDNPVALTFSATSNSGVAMNRWVDQRILEFGTTGKLYKGSTVMYDRQTRSMWLHYNGLCVRGKLTGAKLNLIPVSTVSFQDYRLTYPGGKVLSRQTGYKRKYGRNPYILYGRSDERPFIYEGNLDSRLLPKERVVGIYYGDGAIAYPYSLFRHQGEKAVIHDYIKDSSIVIFYSRGTNSVVDAASIRYSRDVGATGVYLPFVKGKKLRFYPVQEGFKDKETGSLWSLLGKCLKGPLRGIILTPVEHLDSFWFAWAAHYPETKICNNN